MSDSEDDQPDWNYSGSTKPANGSCLRQDFKDHDEVIQLRERLRIVDAKVERLEAALRQCLQSITHWTSDLESIDDGQVTPEQTLKVVISAMEHRMTKLKQALAQATDASTRKPEGIYVASRASIPELPAMWRGYRDNRGYKINSTWIDEAGEGETSDFTELWRRITEEIERSEKLVLYARAEDFPLKGALIEVGIALGMGKPVVACLPLVNLEERSMRPVGSWLAHPLVKRIDSLHDALNYTAQAPDAAKEEK